MVLSLLGSVALQAHQGGWVRVRGVEEAVKELGKEEAVKEVCSSRHGQRQQCSSHRVVQRQQLTGSSRQWEHLWELLS